MSKWRKRIRKADPLRLIMVIACYAGMLVVKLYRSLEAFVEGLRGGPWI
jgi:hypothetical protein